MICQLKDDAPGNQNDIKPIRENINKLHVHMYIKHTFQNYIGLNLYINDAISMQSFRDLYSMLTILYNKM